MYDTVSLQLLVCRGFILFLSIFNVCVCVCVDFPENIPSSCSSSVSLYEIINSLLCIVLERR